MGVTFDFGQLVMDHEFARNVKHVVQGIPVTDETLAIDVIGEVGPFRDFLSHDHTFRHMKTQSQARLIDRRMRGDWEAAGGTTIYERATEEARSILESHQPAPLPDNTVAALRSMVEEAEREFGATRAG